MTRQEKKKIADPEIVTDAVHVAEEAGLRYVSHDQPGYTRKAKGDDFEYFDTEGKPIRDEQRLLRIKRFAIPPAYTDVCGSVRQPTGTFRQRGAMRAVKVQDLPGQNLFQYLDEEGEARRSGSL